MKSAGGNRGKSMTFYIQMELAFILSAVTPLIDEESGFLSQ